MHCNELIPGPFFNGQLIILMQVVREAVNEKHNSEFCPYYSISDSPGAAFSDVIARRADIDMQSKMREDPLYQIR